MQLVLAVRGVKFTKFWGSVLTGPQFSLTFSAWLYREDIRAYISS